MEQLEQQQLCDDAKSKAQTKAWSKRKRVLEYTEMKEYLRQCQEIFEQQKQHDHAWCRLRIVMGYSAVLLLVAIMVIGAIVLLHSAQHSDIALVGASVALFTDIVGLFTGVWKIVLNPNFVTKLQPTIPHPFKTSSLEEKDTVIKEPEEHDSG